VNKAHTTNRISNPDNQTQAEPQPNTEQQTFKHVSTRTARNQVRYSGHMEQPMDIVTKTGMKAIEKKTADVKKSPSLKQINSNNQRNTEPCRRRSMVTRRSIANRPKIKLSDHKRHAMVMNDVTAASLKEVDSKRDTFLKRRTSCVNKSNRRCNSGTGKVAPTNTPFLRNTQCSKRHQTASMNEPVRHTNISGEPTRDENTVDEKDKNKEPVPKHQVCLYVSFQCYRLLTAVSIELVIEVTV